MGTVPRRMAMNRMRVLVVVGLAATVASACGSTLPTWKSNTVKLDVDAFSLQEGKPHQMDVQGTGVFLDLDGTLVTNAHVTRRCRRVIARFEDGRSTAVDDILAISPEDDVTVMRARGVADLQRLVLASREDVEKGEEILAVGNVLGLGLSVMPGYVNNIAEIRGREFIIISADLAQGASGGPVFDRQGRLVGLMRGFMQVGGGKQSLVIPAWQVARVVGGGMKGGDCACGGCGGCYSPDAFRCRLKVLERHTVTLEPGEEAGFLLQMEEDRDYSLVVRVQEGVIRLVTPDGSSLRFGPGEAHEAVFTARENTVQPGAFVNRGDETATFQVVWGRVEW